MVDPEVECAYKRLKPPCEKLMKTPDLQSLAEVTNLTLALPNQVLQQIHAYILFPFAVHLKNPQHRTNSKLRMGLVDGFHAILSKIMIECHEIFFKYYTVLVYQFFDKKTEDTIAKLDEDYAVKVCKCLTLLLVRVKPETRIKLYSKKTTPDIGQGIFFSIQVARSEKYKGLRISAVECAMALSTVHDDIYQQLHSPKIDVNCANTVGEVLMFFLPGLLGGLLEIAVNDPKQGEKLTCLAVRAIRRIICIVMLDNVNRKDRVLTNDDFIRLVSNHKSDADKLPNDYDPFGKKFRNKGKEGLVQHLETAVRDDKWYKAAGIKLALIIRSLRPLKAHPQEKVRFELGLLCWNIVEHCIINMSPSMKFILEMLIALSETEDCHLTAMCDDALTKFCDKTENGGRHIMSFIEQNFYTYLSQIPRFLNSLDDHHQLGNMCLLRGYVRFLTMKGQSGNKLSKLEEMISSPFIINRFVLTLIEIFQIETKSVTLLEEYTVRDLCETTRNYSPWKIFTHLNSTKSINVALDMLRILGNHGVADMITDYLFELLRSNSTNRKEIYLILNEIICCPTDNAFKKEHLFKTLINTYIETENWYLPTRIIKPEKRASKNETLDVTVYNPRSWTKETTPGLFEGTTETRYTDISYRPAEEEDKDDSDDENITSCATIVQARDNIIQMCLITEGVGLVAKLLGEKFQPYLLKTLYLILERAGSSNEFLHLAGLKSLQYVTDAFKLKSIAELIRVNSDYFTHHVKVKLRKIADNYSVIDVLLVVMKFSESSILPCLYDIVSNVLYQCFGINQQKNVILYLRLFQTFVKYIKTKFTLENLEREKILAVTAKINIIQQILDFKEQRIKSVDFEDDVDKINRDELNQQYLQVSDGEDNTTEENEMKKKAPPHIKMVAAVISKSLNFIPSKDREHKLLALNIVNEGFPIIKEYEDICLPLVHEVWSPLVNRFKETSQPLVMHRAFQLLITLGDCSRDFIKARTTKDVLPILCKFLRHSSKESFNKDSGSLYRQSQTYKLQMSMLENIGKLYIDLDVQHQQFHCLMESAHLYLSCKQPKPLQANAIELFKQLINHDPSSTWLFIIMLCHENKMIPPPRNISALHEMKKFIYFALSPQKRIEYSKNVADILEYYNNKHTNAATKSFCINSIKDNLNIDK